MPNRLKSPPKKKQRQVLTLDDVARRLMTPRLAEPSAAQAPEPFLASARPAATLPKNAKLEVDATGVFRVTGEHAQLRSLEVRSSAPGLQARLVDFSGLAHLGHLRTLRLYDGLVPSDFGFLASLPKLQTFWCQPPRTVTDLTFLRHQTELKKLYLVLNQITSLETAAAMKQLTELEVSSLALKNAVVTDEWPKLQQLSLSGTNITLQLTAVFKDLRHVFIHANSLRGLDFLGSCPNLEGLGLFFSSPTRGIEPLLKLKRLRVIYGRTRALSRADRDRLEAAKPGVLRLTPG